MSRTATAGVEVSQESFGRIVPFDPARIRPFKDQPRKRFRNIEGLARSIKAAGQITPIMVKLVHDDPEHEAELVDGERRLRAFQQYGHEFKERRIMAIVTNPSSVDDQFERSVAANFGREGHDCIEVAKACRKFQLKGMTIEAISDIFGKSKTWVTQHLSLLNLRQDVQEMLVTPEEDDLDEEKVESNSSKRKSKRKLTFSLALLIAPLPPDLQVRSATHITEEGLTLVKARRHILQLARETGHTAGIRPQQPGERLGSLITLVDHMRDSVGVFLDMKGREFGQMFEGRPPVIKQNLVRALEAFAEDLNGLTKAIKQ